MYISEKITNNKSIRYTRRNFVEKTFPSGLCTACTDTAVFHGNCNMQEDAVTVTNDNPTTVAATEVSEDKKEDEKTEE